MRRARTPWSQSKAPLTRAKLESNVAIFHITANEDWGAARAGGSYRLSTRGQSLDDVGFIHCSKVHQVTGVANAVYRGVHGLVLLVIDPQRVTAPIREESPNGSDGTERYPHIYGPLNVEAVVEVVKFEPSSDGTFELPPNIRDQASDP
jgi:glutathione S-transferase